MKLKRTVHGLSTNVGNSILCAADGSQYRTLGQVVLANAPDGEQTMFEGHDGDITSATLSPDNRYLATGQVGPNADVIVWSTAERRLLYRFSEYDDDVSCVLFSHDSRLIATICSGEVSPSSRSNAGAGGTGVGESVSKLIIWDSQTGNIVTSSVLRGRYGTIAWSGGFHSHAGGAGDYTLAVAGTDGIVLCEVDPFEGSLSTRRVELGSTSREFISMAFNRDGSCVFAGSMTGDIIRVGTRLLNVQGRSSQIAMGGVKHLRPCHGGLLLATGDGTVAHFNGDSVGKAVKLDSGITSISPRRNAADDAEFVVGTSRGNVYRLSIGGMEYEKLESHHSEGLTKVALIGDDVCLTCGETGTVCTWDLATMRRTGEFVGRNGRGERMSVTSLAVCDDIILTGWENGCVRALGRDTLREHWRLDDIDKGAISSIIVDGDHKFMMTGGSSGHTRMWSLADRRMVSDLSEHIREVTDLVLINDDRWVISASKDCYLISWDLVNKRRVAEYRHRSGGINSIGVASENVIIAVGLPKSIGKWRLDHHLPEQLIEIAHDGEVMCVRMAPDRRTFITGSVDSYVKVWDTERMEVLCVCRGHSGAVKSIATSEDGSTFVSCSDDGSLSVYKIVT